MIPLNDYVNQLKRSGIRRFTNLAKTVPGCVMLTIGEPDFHTPQAIKAAAEAALASGKTHYAPNQGIAALCQAVAEYETNRGFPLDGSQVLITAGATGALFTALCGILNPGDEVIVPMPAFPLYESIITFAGAKLVPLDTRETGFQITAESLSAVMTEKTRAIILNSPNNPTGVVYTQSSLAAVKQAVLGKDIFLLCDNVYGQLADSVPDLTLDGELRQQVLLCQSFSKPYAMTGWRCGYLAGPAEVMEKLLLLNAAAIACVPTFVQEACLAALKTDISQMAEAYARRRAYVCRRLGEMGLSFPEPGGAFYVFPEVGNFGLDSETFCTRAILEAGVAMVPGSCFGTEGHVRISCACSDETLEEGLNRLEKWLRTL